MPTSFKFGTELDAFEVLGNQPSILYATVHSANPQAALEQALSVADTSTAFHTYGVDWEPQTTTFYMDGQAIATVATPADMNVPMYMLLNLAVGGAGSWSGAPTAQTQLPADMEIDYVHAYQTANTIGWTDPAPSQPSPLILPGIQAIAATGSAFRLCIRRALRQPGCRHAAWRDRGCTAQRGWSDRRDGCDEFERLLHILKSGGRQLQRPVHHAGRIQRPPRRLRGCQHRCDEQLYAVSRPGLRCAVSTRNFQRGACRDSKLNGASAANVTVKLLDQTGAAISTTQTDTTGRFNFWVARANTPSNTTLQLERTELQAALPTRPPGSLCPLFWRTRKSFCWFQSSLYRRRRTPLHHQ